MRRGLSELVTAGRVDGEAQIGLASNGIELASQDRFRSPVLQFSACAPVRVITAQVTVAAAEQHLVYGRSRNSPGRIQLRGRCPT